MKRCLLLEDLASNRIKILSKIHSGHSRSEQPVQASNLLQGCRNRWGLRNVPNHFLIKGQIKCPTTISSLPTPLFCNQMIDVKGN